MAEFITDLEVGSFELNPLKQIRARLTKINGHSLADIRAFVPNADGVFVPCPQGICLGRGKVKDLLALVTKLAAAIPQSKEEE